MHPCPKQILILSPVAGHSPTTLLPSPTLQEAKRLCGGALTIYPYHGQGRKRDPAFLSNFDMVVTTYGVVQVGGYLLSLVFRLCPWICCS